MLKEETITFSKDAVCFVLQGEAEKTKLFAGVLTKILSAGGKSVYNMWADSIAQTDTPYDIALVEENHLNTVSINRENCFFIVIDNLFPKVTSNIAYNKLIAPYGKKQDKSKEERLTYSAESDHADLVAKNVQDEGGKIRFELLGVNQIGRVKAAGTQLSVNHLLALAGALLCMGISFTDAVSGINELTQENV